MTAVGGLGHALPYLIPDFWTATSVAVGGLRRTLGHRLDPEPLDGDALGRAIFQVVLGGALVFAAGMLIGNA